MANEVSPTNPRVTLVSAASLTGRAKRGATGRVSHIRAQRKQGDTNVESEDGP